MKAVGVRQLKINPSAALWETREQPVMVLSCRQPGALLVHLSDGSLLGEPGSYRRYFTKCCPKRVYRAHQRSGRQRTPVGPRLPAPRFTPRMAFHHRGPRGTGSGKTECFLWPILDYCRRHAGEEGVKAILVYPMNALAFDRAQRIAKAIHDGREHLVTDRETLRERPPHILLTNYKMLDFLMIRPADRRLWRHNQPSTLRYLVVDELHTFDGPQGTDLACLVRRLRERLQVPRQESARQAPARQGLICVGTSATVGDERSGAELRRYAADVFGQAFDECAILREERQSIDELLGTAIIQTHIAPQPNLAERVDPARYPMGVGHGLSS